MFRSFIFLTLVVSLASVLVGNALSFHLHQEKTSVEVSLQTEWHDSATNCEHQDVDPCATGHCHLGHCAILLSSEDTGLASPLILGSLYTQKNKNLLDRSIDGPFQPPKHTA